jgi:hypothetical protein
LAVQALDRIVAHESEWRELWEDAGEFEGVETELQAIRASLGG